LTSTFFIRCHCLAPDFPTPPSGAGLLRRFHMLITLDFAIRSMCAFKSLFRLALTISPFLSLSVPHLSLRLYSIFVVSVRNLRFGLVRELKKSELFFFPPIDVLFPSSRIGSSLSHFLFGNPPVQLPHKPIPQRALLLLTHHLTQPAFSSLPFLAGSS